MSTVLDTPPTSTPPSGAPGRPILVATSVALVLALAIGIVLAVTRSTSYPEGSPERVAQEYLQALMDDDAALARTYLAPDLAARCEGDEPHSWWVQSADTIRFTDVRTESGRVVIDLDLSSLDPIDPFSIPFDDRYDPTRDAELVLDEYDGTWLIAEAAWPLHQCTQR